MENEGLYAVSGRTMIVTDQETAHPEWKHVAYAIGNEGDVREFYDNGQYIEVRLDLVDPVYIDSEKTEMMQSLIEQRSEVRHELDSLPSHTGWSYDNARWLKRTLERISCEISALQNQDQKGDRDLEEKITGARAA